MVCSSPVDTPIGLIYEPRNFLSNEIFFADLYLYVILEQIQPGCPGGNLGQLHVESISDIIFGIQCKGKVL